MKQIKIHEEQRNGLSVRYHLVNLAEWSTRTLNVFKSAGLASILDVYVWEKKRGLMKIPNCGMKTFIEINFVLTIFGFPPLAEFKRQYYYLTGTKKWVTPDDLAIILNGYLAESSSTKKKRANGPIGENWYKIAEDARKIRKGTSPKHFAMLLRFLYPRE